MVMKEGYQLNQNQLFENLITKKDLSRRIGMSISFINKYIPHGLPHKKFGRSIRFRLDEVIAWLERRT